MASDMEVIEAVLAGDVDRYAELVTRYQRAAWGLAYGMVANMDDARELSQAGFAKAFRHLRAFRRQAAFSTWLYRIVMNECKDHLRRLARMPRTVPLVAAGPADAPELEFELADSGNDPAVVAQQHELAHRIAQGIAVLRGNAHEAFLLHHVHGLSLEETAQILQCRVGTVKTHVFRACEQLRRLLSDLVKEG